MTQQGPGQPPAPQQQPGWGAPSASQQPQLDQIWSLIKARNAARKWFYVSLAFLVGAALVSLMSYAAALEAAARGESSSGYYVFTWGILGGAIGAIVNARKWHRASKALRRVPAAAVEEANHAGSEMDRQRSAALQAQHPEWGKPRDK